MSPIEAKTHKTKNKKKLNPLCNDKKRKKKETQIRKVKHNNTKKVQNPH